MTSPPQARPVPTGWPVDERSMLGTVLGLPGYAAIAIAFGFTGLGVFIDLNRISTLGTIFKGCYFAGCVLSVCWVKRRALFGPMVQPPLLLAIAVPGVVALSGSSGGNGGGLADRALSIGAPLLNGFPTMALATAFTLAIAIARYVLQRPPPVRQPRPPARGAPRAARSRSGPAELQDTEIVPRPGAERRARGAPARPTDRPEGRDRPETRARRRAESFDPDAADLDRPDRPRGGSSERARANRARADRASANLPDADRPGSNRGRTTRGRAEPPNDQDEHPAGRARSDRASDDRRGGSRSSGDRRDDGERADRLPSERRNPSRRDTPRSRTTGGQSSTSRSSGERRSANPDRPTRQHRPR